ncbi:MAG: fumarate hydratase [Phycisphaerae bacterium]
MRKIEYQKIVDAVKELCVSAAHRLPVDVLAALEKSIQTETDAQAKHILKLLVDNARLADQELYPLCQDTGVAIVFIEQGNEVFVEASKNDPQAGLFDAVNDGVKAGYEEGYLRKSIVYDPIKTRQNTNTNTPAIIYHSFVRGDKLKLTLMLKGGGCENRSRIHMLVPAEGEDGVKNFVLDTVMKAGADACPPFIVGVGIGGNFEMSCLLAKKAMLRPLDSFHPEPFYAAMEKDLLEQINNLNIGPQGMGGKTTALAVLIETYPCHIASLPVAVNIECHSHRHSLCVL